MCLIVFAYNEHKKYKLIFASNRDESYKRPTLDAHRWESNPKIIAGKDLQLGGTWLGLSENGLLAAVTNYRDPGLNNNHRLSRGFLVTNFVLGNKSSKDYLDSLESESDKYNAFNLLVADKEFLYYYSNIEHKIKEIKSGIHGLSNHLLDTPWPKVEYAKKSLEEVIVKDEISEEAIFNFMKTEHQFSEQNLPDTGVGIKLEKVLSPLFIKTNGYGTRCSTIITIDYDNNATFSERVYDTQTSEYHDNKFSLKLLS